MNASRELDLLLRDIIEWGERLEQHVASMTLDQFRNNPLAVDAICWCIACVGEAAGRARALQPDLANSEFQLAEAYAMRNRLSHGYYSLDERIIWNTAVNKMPALVRIAREHLGG